MSNPVFMKASAADVEDVYYLTEARVKWMDQKGIRQWNVTKYLEAYPLEYYQEMERQGLLYVMKKEGAVIGAVVLLEEDDRWDDQKPSLYIHNLVTDPAVRGMGDMILKEAEKLAVEKRKDYLRLDCAVDNDFLNRYYVEHGFEWRAVKLWTKSSLNAFRQRGQNIGGRCGFMKI